jgi:hypothetical protein
MRSRVQKALIEYPEISVTWLDVDDDQEKAEKFTPGNVLPVMVFVDNDKVLARIIGEVAYKKLIITIKDITS